MHTLRWAASSAARQREVSCARTRVSSAAWSCALHGAGRQRRRRGRRRVGHDHDWRIITGHIWRMIQYRCAPPPGLEHPQAPRRRTCHASDSCLLLYSISCVHSRTLASRPCSRSSSTDPPTRAHSVTGSGYRARHFPPHTPMRTHLHAGRRGGETCRGGQRRCAQETTACARARTQPTRTTTGRRACA